MGRLHRGSSEDSRSRNHLYSHCARTCAPKTPLLRARQPGCARLAALFLLSSRVTADSLFYADIAKNWLLHGIYARTYEPGQIVPHYRVCRATPAFSRWCSPSSAWTIFAPPWPSRFCRSRDLLPDGGSRAALHFRSRRQGCLSAHGALPVSRPVLRRRFSRNAGNFLHRSWPSTSLSSDSKTSLRANCALDGRGLAVAACILLRPDGGLLLLAIGVYLGILLWRAWRSGSICFPSYVLDSSSRLPRSRLFDLGVRNRHTLDRWRIPCASLRQRGRRIRSPRLQSLAQHLDRGLHLHRRNRLERAG